MTTLDVRDLSVEVGGKTVVADLSFTLRAGDKMGVVGRNGAGKTSLLKVLGGEDLPLSGTVTRTGAIGYLRQDPASTAPTITSRVSSTSSPRGIWWTWRGGWRRRASSSRNRTRTRTSLGSRVWRRSIASSAATRRSRRRARSPPASAWRTTAWRCRSACSRAGSGDAWSSPASCSVEATSDARRADQPPGRRREALADEVPGATAAR